MFDFRAHGKGYITMILVAEQYESILKVNVK